MHKVSYEHRTGAQHRVRVIPKHSWTNITYRTDFREYGFHAISRLTRTPTVKNLVGGRTYYFQVLANSATNFGASDQVKFPVPARVKHKAITAGVVGGILFFLVAIILSICAVKICNKRKRRKQEKGMKRPVALSTYRTTFCPQFAWTCAPGCVVSMTPPKETFSQMFSQRSPTKLTP